MGGGESKNKRKFSEITEERKQEASRINFNEARAAERAQRRAMEQHVQSTVAAQRQSRRGSSNQQAAKPEPANAPPINMSQKLESLFNLKRHTIQLHQEGSKYSITFNYDSIIDISVTVFFAAMEVLDPNCTTLYVYSDTERYPQPIVRALPAGMDVPIPQGILEVNTDAITEDICIGKFPQVYPVIFEIKENSPEPTLNIIAQTTNLIFKKTNGKYEPEVAIQKIHLQGMSLEQCEIFGLDKDETEDASEWVVCLSEPAAATVLPCRHHCVCVSCAKLLKAQANPACPM